MIYYNSFPIPYDTHQSCDDMAYSPEVREFYFNDYYSAAAATLIAAFALGALASTIPLSLFAPNDITLKEKAYVVLAGASFSLMTAFFKRLPSQEEYIFERTQDLLDRCKFLNNN